MSSYFLTVVLLYGLQGGSAPRAATAPTVAARLAAYEQQVATGKADPAELAAIARTVIDATTSSTRPPVMIEGCASDYVQDSECAAKLWALARRSTAVLADRARAAALLAGRKDKEAAAYLLGLVAKATPAQFTAMADAVAPLAPEASVPLLSRMLESKDGAAITAACRLLGAVDAPQSREALQRYLASAPRFTTFWFPCVLASARLGDPESKQLARFITTYLKGFDLVTAGELLLDTDQELAVSLLMQATRQSMGVTRLDAADRLVPVRPEVAQAVMEQALPEQDSDVRSAALQVHRHLKLDPGPAIRNLLLDSDPIVRLRAAETILEWEKRRALRAEPALGR